MSYYLVKALSYIICRLPDSVRIRLGDMLGAICWPFVPAKRRQMAVNNVMSSLRVGQDEALEIVRNSTVRFGRIAMALLAAPKFNKHNIARYVKLINAENLEKGYSYGNGVILATSHCGNWEMAATAVALNGYPLTGVVQKQTSAGMDRFINEHRTVSGVKIVYKTGVRDMIAELGKGAAIGLLMDQDDKAPGAIFVDFFDRPASTPPGAAALARLKNAPIVPAFAVQNEDGTDAVIFHPPVWVEKTADREADLRKTTQILTKIIEDHIRLYPGQWFWLHNRWKTQPRVQP